MPVGTDMQAVFVVGNSRSGTSVMGRILGNHPDIYTLIHEIHFFDEIAVEDIDEKLTYDESVRLYALLLSIINEGYLVRGRNITRYVEDAKSNIKAIKRLSGALTSKAIYRHFLSNLAEMNSKIIACEQTPRYLFFLKEITDTFPDARIVNMVRDPRDILLSQKNKWRLKYLGHSHIPLMESIRSWANYHSIITSKLWGKSLDEYDNWREDERSIFVRFEDLLDHAEETVKQVCKFLGINFDPAMLQVPEVGSSHDRYSSARIGIDLSKKERWRRGGLSNAEVFICERINGNRLKRYGYEVSRIIPSPVLLFWIFLSFPLKLFLAFVFNSGRFYAFRRYFKRRKSSSADVWKKILL